MSTYAEQLAERLRGVTLEPDPWPHGTLDDFLPADVFAELAAAIPGMKMGEASRKRRCEHLPAATVALLTSPVVLDALRERFGFTGGRVMLEAAWFGPRGLKAHVDRADKLWNGQVYLTGDPKGTELFDAQDKLAKVVEWQPNRFTCWPPPGSNLKHAAPQSKGRVVLLWWILDDRPKQPRPRLQRKR